MYWWNISKLADDLQEGRVDEKDRYKYFLATFLAWNIGIQLLIYYGGTFETEHVVPVIGNVVVTIIGISLCYNHNRLGDNNDFIGRMFCLGWPAAFRTIAVGLALSAFVIVALSPIDRQTPLSVALGTFLNSFLWAIIGLYFTIIQIHISYVAKPKDTEPAICAKKQAMAMEKGLMGLLVASLGGSLAWVGIVRIGLPGPANFILGISLVAGLVWCFMQWGRTLDVGTKTPNREA